MDMLLVLLGLLCAIVPVIVLVVCLVTTLRTRSDTRRMQADIEWLTRQVNSLKARSTPPSSEKPDHPPAHTRPAPPPAPSASTSPPPHRPAEAPSSGAGKPPPISRPSTPPPHEPAPARASIEDSLARARRPYDEEHVSARGDLPASSDDRSKPSAGEFSESAVARRALTWAGVLAVFASVGFFIKYAVDQHWIVLTPTGRVAMGLAVGLAFAVAGIVANRRDMRPLGQGLVGGGLAILYLALYAAWAFWDEPLWPQEAIFAAMVGVTAAGLAIAVILNALSTGVLALIGGMLTPLLVGGEAPRPNVLFTYLLILDAGVFGVAFARRWKALDSLAFFGTAVWYALWLIRFYETPDLPLALAWLGTFYAVFAAIPFVHAVRRHGELTGLRFVAMVGHAMATLAAVSYLLYGDHRIALGWAVLAMGAVYGVQAAILRLLRNPNRHAVIGYSVLGMFMVTLSVAYFFRLDGRLLAWSGEAVALLVMGYRLRFKPLRIGAAVIQAIALAWLVLGHWPMADPEAAFAINREFATVAAMALGLGLFAGVHRWHRDLADEDDRALLPYAVLATIGLALTMLHREFMRTLPGWASRQAVRIAPVLLWSAGTVTVGALAAWLGRAPYRVAALGVYAVALAMAFLLVDSTPPVGQTPVLNARLLVSLVPLAVAVAGLEAVRSLGRRAVERTVDPVLGALSGFGILWLAADDFRTLLDRETLAALCLVATWMIGSAAAMAGAVLGRRAHWLFVSVTALCLASIEVTRMYVGDWPRETLFVNARFVASALPAVLWMVYGRLIARDMRLRDMAREAAGTGWAVAGLGILGLWLLLSAEVWQFCTEGATGETREAAVRRGNLSLSLVWGLYAAAMMTVGFWRRVRPLRLVALGLFGVTCVKLVFVDIWSSLEPLYRIAAFAVLGMLMIGVSYAYHVVERRMRAGAKSHANEPQHHVDAQENDTAE